MNYWIETGNMKIKIKNSIYFGNYIMQIDEKMKADWEKWLAEICNIVRDFAQIDEADASDEFLQWEWLVVLFNSQMNSMMNALWIYSDDTTWMIRNFDNIALYMRDHHWIQWNKLLKLKKDLWNVLRKYWFDVSLITRKEWDHDKDKEIVENYEK